MKRFLKAATLSALTLASGFAHAKSYLVEEHDSYELGRRRVIVGVVNNSGRPAIQLLTRGMTDQETESPDLYTLSWTSLGSQQDEMVKRRLIRNLRLGVRNAFDFDLVVKDADSEDSLPRSYNDDGVLKPVRLDVSPGDNEESSNSSDAEEAGTWQEWTDRVLNPED